MPRVFFIMRKDLNMSPGKLAVQCGHGVDYVHLNQTISYKTWLFESKRRKIALAAQDLKELDEIKAILTERKVPFKEIWDAGLTEFDGPTHTGIVVLPWPPGMIPGKIKFLPLWK